MRLVYVDTILIPFRAICLYPFVILIRKKYRGDFGLIRHELIHWRQANRMGFLGLVFYLRYIFQFIVLGYDNMPLELEARQGETWYGLWNYKQKNFK